MKKIFLIVLIYVGMSIPQKILAQNLQFNKILHYNLNNGGIGTNTVTGSVPSNQTFEIISTGVSTSGSNPNSSLKVAIDTTGGSSLSDYQFIEEFKIINSVPFNYKASLPMWLPSGSSYNFYGYCIGCTGTYEAYVNIIVYDIVP